ncbi:MAG: tetratricopeptide repeat protein [Bacteroidota bacterium]
MVRLSLSLLLLFIVVVAYCQEGQKTSQQLQEELDSLASAPYSAEVYRAHQSLNVQSQQINFKQGEAQASQWMGNYAIELGELETARTHYQKLVSISEELQDSTLRANGFFSLAVVNSELLQLEEAVELFQRAAELSIQIRDTFLQASVVNGLGIAHAKGEQYELAVKYLKEARNLMDEIDVAGGVQNANYNIAYIHLLQELPLAAQPFAFEYLAFAREKGDSIDLASGYSLVGKTLHALGQYDKALIYCDSALQLSEVNQLKNLKSEVLAEISEIYESKQEFQLALRYHKEYSIAGQAYINEETKKNIAELDIKYETERNKRELLLKEKEVSEVRQKAKLNQQRMLMVVGGLIACIIIGFLYFLKVRSETREKTANELLIRAQLEYQDLKNAQLKTELDNKKSDLTNLALDISRKNDFSNQLIERLDQIKSAKSSDVRGQLKSVTSFVINHLQINEDLAILQENVETVNKEFYQKLEQNFGELTATDKHLAALIRLNLSNKEVAVIRGISTASAKMSRHRLRKKLGLEPQEDITRFLQDI